MSTLIEIDINTLALSDGIDWVGIGIGGQDMVVSYWAGDQEHKITYADNAAAIAAVSAWKLAVNRQELMQIGDAVTVSPQQASQGSLGASFDAILRAFPDSTHGYWAFQTPSAILYMDHVTVSKAI